MELYLHRAAGQAGRAACRAQAAADPATGIAIAQVRLTPMRVSVVFEGPPDEPGCAMLSRAQIVLGTWRMAAPAPWARGTPCALPKAA